MSEEITSQTTILLPRSWDKLLGGDPEVTLQDINKAMYHMQPTDLKANMTYRNYHALIKPLEKEGITTWVKLCTAVEEVGNKISNHSKRIRDLIVITYKLIVDMSKFSDDQYDKLTDDEKAAISEGQVYFNYGNTKFNKDKGSTSEQETSSDAVGGDKTDD